MRVTIDLDARDAMGAPGTSVTFDSDRPSDMPGNIGVDIIYKGVGYSADEVREALEPRELGSIRHLLSDKPFHGDVGDTVVITPEEKAIKELAHYCNRLAARVADLEEYNDD